MTWEELQSDITAWSLRNFGENPAWRPTLGLIEEVAEYLDAENSRSIVGMRDALGDQAIYALALCEQVGIPFERDVAGDPSNIPTPYSERELLGTLGLASRAILKHSQGIRRMNDEARREHLRICLGIWYRWAGYQVLHKHRLSTVGLFPIVQMIWADVRQRDWRKNPETASPKQEEVS